MLGLVLVSCSKESSTTAAPSTTTRPTIVIVTYSAYVIDPRVKRSVERQLGVRLKISQTGDASQALSAAILTAGKPEGDVFFGVDNPLLTRATSAAVLERLASADVPNLASVPKSFDLDQTHQLVPVDSGPVCVDYDAQWFQQHGVAPPTSLADLTAPRYRDLTIVENPATSSTGLVFLLATHAALGDGVDAWWRALAANGVSVSGDWTDAWETQYSVSGGKRPIVVSYATSPPAEVVFSNGKVTEPRTRVVTSTCADQVEFAGVLRGTSHPEEARKVLNAMLGAEWQAGQPLTNFVYPVRTGVPLPDVFTKFAIRPEQTITLDPVTVDKNRDAWIGQWRSIVE